MRKFIFIIQILFLTLGLNGQDSFILEEQLLARILTAECSICDEKELMLVGSAVLNRADSKDFPDTILGVIQQPKQFHGYQSRWYITTPRTLKIARKLLNGEGRNYEVLYFHTNDCACKKFADSLKDKIIIKLEYHTYATK